jgi:hypothetical protein
MTLQELSQLDLTKVTQQQLSEIMTDELENQLYNQFAMFRGIKRHFIFLKPCWAEDFEKFDNEDKRFATEILKFSLSFNRLQDIKT